MAKNSKSKKIASEKPPASVLSIDWTMFDEAVRFNRAVMTGEFFSSPTRRESAARRAALPPLKK